MSKAAELSQLEALNMMRARCGFPPAPEDYFSPERVRERDDAIEAQAREDTCRLLQMNHGLSEEETAFLRSLVSDPGMTVARLDAYGHQLKAARQPPPGGPT